METSDGVKTVLSRQAEAGVLKLLASLQELKEGDLKELEQQVMESVFTLGRNWMHTSRPVNYLSCSTEHSRIMQVERG
jgi:hypothetical protein